MPYDAPMLQPTAPLPWISLIGDQGIETQSLVLRGIRPGDLDDLMAVNGDAAVTQHLPYDTWQTLADATRWFARMHALQTEGSGCQLVIEHRVERRVVGTLLLFRYEPGSSRVELGYVLARRFWGQGLMSEAIKALCSHVFRMAPVRRIEAEVSPANTASCKVLESLGFQREGLLRQRWASKGVAYDTAMYACLSHEWRHG